MNTYFANVWDSLRTSFWFVPALLGIVAILGSLALPAIDARIPDEVLGWCATTTPAARSTLSAIAAAMMTVAGTVFSITVVTLSLASQQFGPRLLRSFMLDFPTQLTIGTFLATGVYCLLVLRILEDHSAESVPHLSVALAVGLTVVSMGLLIFFVHHVAVLIQAPHIVAAVARDLDESICRLFPERIGQAVSSDEERQQTGHAQRDRLGDDFQIVPSRSEGYIQAVDANGLLLLAQERDLVIELLRRPGHYVSEDGALAKVWRCDTDRVEKVSRLVNEYIIVGVRRTPRQDVECAIEELVEVAVRSLSPGINDPFTAINCIDRLGSTLGRLAQRKAPSRFRSDDQAALRVIAPSVTFASVLQTALGQIRHYGSQCPAVLVRLLDALASMNARAVRPEDRQTILEQADQVLRLAERSLGEQDDLDTVRKRHQAFRASDAV